MTVLTHQTMTTTAAPLAAPLTAAAAAPSREAALLAALAAAPAEIYHADPRLATGWYSDRYFIRTAATLALAGRDPIVRIQVFAKKPGVLAGVYEVIRLLEDNLAPHPETGERTTLRDYHIETLLDGDAIEPGEPVMHITGPYLPMAHLETPLLGILARRTLVASNVRAATTAARGKPVIFMAARHDDWRVQTPDGYAARVGGAGSVSSHANGAWWGAEGVGTMPHALIAAMGGDTVAATVAFARYVIEREPGVGVISLVDYDNDVVGTSLAVARAMRERFGDRALAGVRLDTSERLVDASLQKMADANPDRSFRGVCPELVTVLRTALDAEGFGYVKIGVSGGFTPAKIRRFEDSGVAVDFYGVGSSLLGHNSGDGDGLATGFDFTADIVTVDGRPESKIGRERRDNGRFVTLDIPSLLQQKVQGR